MLGGQEYCQAQQDGRALFPQVIERFVKRTHEKGGVGPLWVKRDEDAWNRCRPKMAEPGGTGGRQASGKKNIQSLSSGKACHAGCRNKHLGLCHTYKVFLIHKCGKS